MGYSELGQCILEHKHIELVQSVTINEAPKLRMTRTVCIPARSIAVLNTTCNIEQTHLGQIYKTSLDHLIQNEYPKFSYYICYTLYGCTGANWYSFNSAQFRNI